MSDVTDNNSDFFTPPNSLSSTSISNSTSSPDQQHQALALAQDGNAENVLPPNSEKPPKILNVSNIQELFNTPDPNETLKNLQLALNWNPAAATQQAPEPLPSAAVRRIAVEISDNEKNPIEGIHLALDESNIAIIHALIIGPKDTPYENGFFYFYVRIPANYPWDPPKVKLMTTGNSKVRFNPNLYNNGKVCLSILGTWPGPSWTAALTVRSVLLSIQSIMNKNPFFNEPAYEGKESTESLHVLAKEYADNVLYETIRVAVLDMVESCSWPLPKSTSKSCSAAAASNGASANASPSTSSSSALAVAIATCRNSGESGGSASSSSSSSSKSAATSRNHTRNFGDAANMPQALKDKVKLLFHENLDYYQQIINQNLNSTKYNYKLLNTRLEKYLNGEWLKEKQAGSTGRGIEHQV